MEVGTYLLREGDPITVRAAFHIADENRLSVHPFLATVVEGEGKITDILIFKTSKGWIFYGDDPNLNDPDLYKYVSSPQELLKERKGVLKHPIPRGSH